MSKGMKVWLWIALALSVCTTTLNAFSGRWLSVGIAVCAMAGLCILLFAQKKWGFWLLCTCYVFSFIVGIYPGLMGEISLLPAIGMSLVGSALIPLVTYFFVRANRSFFGHKAA